MSLDIFAAPWWVSMLITLALIAVGAVYALGWGELRRAFPNVIDVRRLAAFMAGLFVLWIAVASPLAALDHQFLTAHMAQHLVLMTIAAPLLLVGCPIVTILHGLSGHAAHRLLRPLRNSHVQTLGSVVAHPAFCWFIGTATVIAWHVPALFEAGMQSESWHAVEQASFIAAGLLFWWPIIVPWPSVARWSQWTAPLYLFLATLPCDALSSFLTFCDRVVYPHYQSADRALTPSAIGDQEIAGALMWIWVTFAYLAPAAVLTIRALSPLRRPAQVEFV
jgi:cytochrome c oxidase assembly factor CtaG